MDQSGHRKHISITGVNRLLPHIYEENTAYESQLDSLRYVSQSQAFLKDICNKKDAFFVSNRPSDKRVFRQKTPSADDIYNSRPGLSLHFSPGTNASNTTMTKRLELLKKRCELRKAVIKTSEAPNSISDYEENENVDASVQSPQNGAISSTSISSKTTNATYVVQPLPHEVERDFTSRYKKTEMDKKLIHQAALTSWLNYLLDENSDITDNSEISAKSKKDADLYLWKLLTSGNDIPMMKDNEPQDNISYRCFMATNELSEMRARFRLLYENSPIPNDIADVVKNGKIAVRMDRRIYADVGLQVDLLNLLLSFHPFYLRLGLETILSINIGIKTNFKTQLRIIASAITQNIFKNPKIMNNRKYVQGRAKILINERGTEALLQHFLTKICQFLFIVDKAWRDDVISRKNRCIFVKWSAYKSINDVVAALSRELMTGTSNLPKTLSRLGLFLDRKQGFFEEFQYHVTDLLKDLSNGMILGRTVEILADLQNGTVIHCLRDPGGDRLRKVGNVKTVIDFAKRKGLLPEDLYVDIEGIVQGNIDEIISLLWRFVGKELGSINDSDNCDAEVDSISQQLLSLFGMSYEIRNPLELADGKLFSFLWKQYYSYGTPFELFAGTTVLEKIANAAECHFGIPSLMLLKWKNTPEEKALCLFTKIFISRIYECYKLTSSAIVIQRAFRRYRYRSTLKMDYNVPHKSESDVNTYVPDKIAQLPQVITEEDLERTKASVTIQRYFRGWFARTLYQKMKCDKTLQEREAKAVIIQKFIRGWLARTSYRKLLHEQNTKKRENASIVIQSCIRGWLARLHYRNLLHEVSSSKRESAAITLQKFIRGWLARTFYRKLLHEQNTKKRENASIVIQSRVRGWLARLHYRNLSHEISSRKRENAAITLQQYVRGWIARKNYHKMRHEVALRKQEYAAITLQRYLRGWLARRNYRLMQRKKVVFQKEDAVFIVQNFISDTESRDERFGNKMHGCKVISSKEHLQILRELKMQHNRLRFRRQKFFQAVEDKIKLALLLRSERNRRIKAATIIQAWWRGYLIRKRYVAVRNKIDANRVARQKAATHEERSERMQPIMHRVMNAMENLNSERLYIRYKATEVLQKFVGLSELCAQYVFNNGCLECVLDSLDSCNRGVGSTEVVIPLCSILWSILKFKIVRNNLEEERRQDIVKQCYHFMLAFHKVPNVVTNLTAVILALNANNEQYKKASYFIAELTKKFAKLSESDERIIALRKLQYHAKLN
uniref:Calponin-homology (CH) domain-containing protein n=1 Tax=Wuchereria bancrofti TaxID=6293 RepID=A0AAF5PN83_WUCBA